jgi:uncharacterized protein YPO0396
MAEGNIVPMQLNKAHIDPGRIAQAQGSGDGDGGPPDMTEISERLSKLEGAYDALKVVRPMAIAVIGIVLAVMLGGFTFLGAQISRLDNKIDTNSQRLNDKIDANAARLNEKLDAIPQRLADEFRAMRAEMSAQTSAIAASIAAARQAPSQVLLIPAPAVAPPAQKP